MRLTPDQKIAGSTPAVLEFLCFFFPFLLCDVTVTSELFHSKQFVFSPFFFLFFFLVVFD